MAMNKISGLIKILLLIAFVSYGCGGKPVEEQNETTTLPDKVPQKIWCSIQEKTIQETAKVILLS